MKSISEVAYKNYDNTIQIELLNEGINIPDYSGITKALLQIDGQEIDSISFPSIVEVKSSFIQFNLGLSVLTKGMYKGVLVTFDIDNPNGIVWEDSLMIEVK